MSIESVYKKGLESTGETENPRLLLDIEKQRARLERCVYTYWNRGRGMALFQILAGRGRFKGMGATQVKHVMYAEEKEKATHDYLTMLCDLFDYKAGEVNENNNLYK